MLEIDRIRLLVIQFKEYSPAEDRRSDDCQCRPRNTPSAPRCKPYPRRRHQPSPEISHGASHPPPLAPCERTGGPPRSFGTMPACRLASVSTPPDPAPAASGSNERQLVVDIHKVFVKSPVPILLKRRFIPDAKYAATK